MGVFLYNMSKITKIYLAQLCHENENQFQNKCFPLAIGYIAAHLEQVFKGRIEVDLFKSPTSFNTALKTSRPDIVMLSSYMWNENLTCEFASNIKQKYPDTLIVLGGPNISIVADKRKEFLLNNPSIDLMVNGDGEFVAEEIVEFFIETKSIKDAKRRGFPYTCAVENSEYHIGPEDGEHRLGMAKDKTSMDEFPSPYLMGLFDKFFKDGESPLLETNRGCPFTCTYCQQGGKYFQKVRQFPPGRFRDELNYIAEKIQELNVDITMIEMTDPNFGMFKRDEEICRYIRECQDRYDFPQFVGSSTGKNRADTIIKNTSLLKEGSIFLRSSMQSLNMDALRAVKRQNIDLKAYRDIQQDMENKNLESNADMMLGFPNETMESHCEGILTLIDTGTKEFAQYQTIILKGTEFEKEEYQREHGIETKERPIPECFREYKILGKKRKVIETERIIVKTSSMTFAEYLECRRLHLIVMLFHNSRLLDMVYEYMISYNFQRSDIIKKIMESNNNTFLNIIDGYTKETCGELFESIDQMFDVDDLTNYTHNKIFRYMAIAFFLNREVIVEVIKEALLDLMTSEHEEAIGEMCEILFKRIISPKKPPKKKTIFINNEKLIRVFGQKVCLEPTSHQMSSIRMLGKIYKSEDDIINKLIYHLRPKNTVLKIGYNDE